MPLDFSSRTLLQVIPKLIGGGAERTTLEVARAFRKAGGRSIVVSSGGPMTAELEADGSEHVTMPVDSKNPLLIAQNGRDLAAFVAREGVSVIHARSRAPAWSCLLAARRTGCPFVTTYHGAYRARSAPKRFYNSVMVRSDAIIANSGFTARAIRAEYHGRRFFDAARMTTIPRGADLGRFDPAAVPAAAVDAARALFGDGLRVLMPGRFTPWKGQRVAVEAAACLARDRPDIPLRLLMIGRMDEKPAYVDELRDVIGRDGIADRVSLHDAADDIAPVLFAADLVLSASTQPEAFGRVAVEAQAAGRPIIATAHGGSMETVIDGETGLLVPPGDANALASAVAKLHDQGAGGRDAMGTRGMKHARSRFSIEAMTRATLTVYGGILERWEARGEGQGS